MPRATDSDRQRATRYRRAQREGRLSTEHAAWLAAYDADRRPAAPKPPIYPVAASYAPPPKPAPAPAPPPERAQEPAPASQASAPATGTVALSFDGPATAGTTAIPPAPGQNRCTIPNCPKCKMGVAPMGAVCVTTGERVWPPISKATAKFWAVTILGGIGYLIKFFRSDKEMVTPTDAEVDQVANAIVEVQMRRASWMGAGSDVIGLMSGIGFYSYRAIKAPPKPRQSNAA